MIDVMIGDDLKKFTVASQNFELRLRLRLERRTLESNGGEVEMSSFSCCKKVEV